MKRPLTFAAVSCAALLVAGCSSSDKDSTTASTSSAPSSAVTSAAAASPSAAAPAAASDPRCAPADAAVVAAVQAGLTKSDQRLTNGTVIVDGGLTFLGATTVDGAEKMVNRSDVWIIDSSAVYSSTGGARNGSKWPKASDAPLRVSPGDERVQAVDTCVVNLTRG